MEPTTPRRTIELADPRALRALAHPTRLELVGVLRREGPLTATEAGELIGQSAASCSFHLRQLAKYGLVEEAGGGRGRERPWRATAFLTSWPSGAGDAELSAASDLLSGVIVERLFEQILRWLDAKPNEPVEWQRAADFGDTLLLLSPGEVTELVHELRAAIERFADRPASVERRRVAAMYFALPYVEKPPTEA